MNGTSEQERKNNSRMWWLTPTQRPVRMARKQRMTTWPFVLLINISVMGGRRNFSAYSLAVARCEFWLRAHPVRITDWSLGDAAVAFWNAFRHWLDFTINYERNRIVKKHARQPFDCETVSSGETNFWLIFYSITDMVWNDWLPAVKVWEVLMFILRSYSSMNVF